MLGDVGFADVTTLFVEVDEAPDAERALQESMETGGVHLSIGNTETDHYDARRAAGYGHQVQGREEISTTCRWTAASGR